MYEFVFLSHLWLLWLLFLRLFLELWKLTQRSVPQLIFWLVRTVLFYWFCMVLVLQSDSPFQAQNSCNSHLEKWGRNWSTRWLWCTWNLESLELFGFEKFKFLTSLGLEHSAKHGSCWHLKMADSTNSKGAELSLLSAAVRDGSTRLIRALHKSGWASPAQQ